MKLGLITIYHVPNFGSVLQAFATQAVLEKMGHECQIIRYCYPNEWHYQHGFERPKMLKSIARKIFHAIKGVKDYKDDFRSEFFHYTREYKNLDDLCREDWSNFDVFVVGSDQVWNPRFLIGDSAFMLSFVPNNKPRFSIASSFATDKLPNEYKEKYKEHLSKFKALSVREQNGVDIINNQLGIDKEVFVCLDPTLLLSKEEWLSLIPRSNFRKKRPFILYYMWSYAFEPRPYIYEVVEHYRQQIDNCDVIALTGYSMTESSVRKDWIDAGNSTIPEFIDLFNNADMIITSSFHGTAFAINFGKPLISVVPGTGDDRQSSFLKQVGCNKSIAIVGSSIDDLAPYYEVSEMEIHLNLIRERCIKWLKDNISQP